MSQARLKRVLQSAYTRTSQSAVAWSLAAAIFRALGGVLVLPLMLRKIPSDHLGLWYVFLSLQGVATLFDLGFSPAVTRATGYIWAGAKGLQKFGIARFDPSDSAEIRPNYELLDSLVATMRLYYWVFGVVSGLIMLVGGGAWIWIKTAGLADRESLRWAYAVFVFGGFLNATGDLWPALLQGVNGVLSAQKILFGSALVSLLIMGAGLLANWGIWALVLGTLGSGLFIRWNGRFSFFRLAGGKLRGRAPPHFDLIAKMWPTAWRSGLVTVGRFLVLSANTLICSAFLDLKVTASYGLSLSLITMLTFGSSMFTQMKLPIVNHLRTVGRLDEIIELWIQRTRFSLFFYVAGGVGLLALGNNLLHLIGSKTTLLSQGQLALAILVIGLEMHQFLYATLVVSENQNPFVAPSLITGAVTVLLSLLLTPHIGIWGMLLAQGLTQACFNNWWTVYRAINGLGLSWTAYWRRYAQQPIRI
jgi:O-antigen/teichoic acid export membrane protein